LIKISLPDLFAHTVLHGEKLNPAFTAPMDCRAVHRDLFVKPAARPGSHISFSPVEAADDYLACSACHA
jgi:hypothetical protein